MQMKALQAYGDLVCTPKINKVPFSGERISSSDSTNPDPEPVALYKEITKSPMTRRRTISSFDFIDGGINDKLQSLFGSMYADDLAVAKQAGEGDVKLRFFLSEKDESGIQYSNLNKTINAKNEKEIHAFLTKVLQDYPGSSVIVGVLGFYVPPEWENPYHTKKHTRPHARRLRRGGNNFCLVIDDRSPEEWLEIKKKFRNKVPLTAEENDLLERTLGRSSGIHFNDGTFSQSLSAEGKNYTTKI